MDVEPATMDDLDRLIEQWVALAEEQRAHGSHLRGAANREPMRMTIASYVADGRVFVAREEDVLGFVMFGLEEGALEETATRGFIHNVYVRPAARNEGVGSALLGAAEERLVDAGADVLGLEAMADNEAVRRLYRRRGYRPHRITYERSAGSDTHSSPDG